MTKPIEAEKISQNPFQLHIVSKNKNIPFYKTNPTVLIFPLLPSSSLPSPLAGEGDRVRVKSRPFP